MSRIYIIVIFAYMIIISNVSFSLAEINQRSSALRVGTGIITTENLHTKNNALVGLNLGFDHHRKIADKFTLGLQFEINNWEFNEPLYAPDSNHFAFIALMSIDLAPSIRYYPLKKRNKIEFFLETGLGINLSLLTMDECAPFSIIVLDPTACSRKYLQIASQFGFGYQIPLSDHYTFEIGANYHLYKLSGDEDVGYISFFNISLGILFTDNPVYRG